MTFELTSPAFGAGSAIPRRHTCDGDDLPPPLAWSAPPPGTRSFALLCDDPDAPGGTFHHWAVFDIPGDRRELAEGSRPAPGHGPSQAINDFGRAGYGGPCPPRGHGVHRYRFRLLALDVETLGLDGRANCLEVEAAARRHALATCELVGLYQR